MQNTKFTYENAVTKIEQIKGTPIAVEAQWDGDTQGWFLMMFVIVKTKNRIWKPSQVETFHLGNLSLGGDLRVFNGTVPPYPEATLANEIGEKLSQKYNLEFFFPSPINPDDDCPRWIEKDKAINCADCDKLIIPTDSPYLPKDICYNCHLTREQNERVKTKKPHDDGVNLFLSKGNQVKNLGYASKFESFPISEFIDYQKTNGLSKGVQVVVIENKKMKSIADNLENSIEKELLNYEMPELDETKLKFSAIKKVVFKNQEYDLMQRFNSHHEKISRLIHSFNQTVSAIEDNYEYHIYFKNGFTYRDDSFLRFVNFVKEGSAKTDDVVSNYNGILTESQVLETIEELNRVRCLELSNDTVSITQLGKNIL
ncbi:hypothetical protein [Aquimarina megaterium]|uniref:hypothetical protein n=1 Tax=Aquimarina megaterium TaxID=1443666 RepID=UPI00094251C8|nr:hypothetical protein [Aquimarina megaterium]